MGQNLILRLGPVVLCALLAGAAPVPAQDNDTCMACHGESGMTGTRKGRPIQVTVDAKRLAQSVHKDLDCVACHMDLAADEMAHAGGDPDAAIVDCGTCHGAEQADHLASFHGKAAAKGDPYAPTCKECHGRHDVLPRTNPRSPTNTVNIPQTCGRCHHEGSPVERTHTDIPQDRILENYSESIHGEGLFQKGLTVTAVCTSCHSAHLALPHTEKNSSVSRENIAGTCMKCHARIEEVHQKVIEGRLWEEAAHQIPSCSDCHSPHKIRAPSDGRGMSNRDCLSCHGKPDLTAQRDGKAVSMFVDETAHAKGAHGRVACAQCHSEVQLSHLRPCDTVKSKVNCSVCHAAVVETYQTSIHGQLAARNDPDAPECLDCHDRHATQSRRWPASNTFPRNVPTLCASCHRAGEKAAVRIELEAGKDIVESYKMSTHGVGLLQSGLVVTATCADCHTAHGELPPSDPKSTVNKANVAETCARCHQGIVDVFKASIHGKGEAPEGKELPNCEDCHTSHDISRTDKRDFRFTMMQQCGRCHADEAETFFQTYHGKVSQLGQAGAAKCSDCHGAHDILPTTDTHSRLSRDRVIETCGQCHPGSNRRFAGYLTHATHHDRERYPALYYAFLFMTSLLVGTLTFAAAHTGSWLWRLWRSRELWKHHKALVATSTEKQVLRFDTRSRVMHIVMVLSFFTLAITGMALKFSYMGWAQWVSTAFGGSDAMGVFHRLAATAMTALFAYHLVDVAKRKRRSGLSWFRFIFGKDSMMFNLTDLKDVIGSFKWFLGLGPRPEYGRFTYWEKFDYFAVFWGMIVIGGSGLFLWFPELFTRILPGWAINVATIIHSDEALLATAFIFTVHFFNTHFRPDKFPMDPVIFTGRVPVEELKYDKPFEYRELVETGQLEARLVDPMPKETERWFRLFGYTALTIGLTLIVAIIYTMLFGYK